MNPSISMDFTNVVDESEQLLALLLIGGRTLKAMIPAYIDN